MPSKLGFGNTRKKSGKASYGSAMHYKNPIMKAGGKGTKKETDAEFEARMKKEGTTMLGEVNVKKSDKLTERDYLAKKIQSNISTTGGEVSQGIKSKSYKEADKYLVRTKGDEQAKGRLKQREYLLDKTKREYEARGGKMTQKEIDRMMSGRE